MITKNENSVINSIISFVDLLKNAGLIEYKMSEKIAIKKGIFNSLDKYITK